MKYSFLLLFVFILAASSFQQLPLKQQQTCYVSGHFFYAPNNGKNHIRGINKMNEVTDPTDEKSFPQIAKTGANCVRIMWMRWGGGGKQLDTILGNCVKYKMQPLIELHDATRAVKQTGYLCKLLVTERCGDNHKKIPKICAA